MKFLRLFEERIIGVYVIVKGQMFYGATHADAFYKACDEDLCDEDMDVPYESGFLTDYGRKITDRDEAWDIAVKAGQKLPNSERGDIHSFEFNFDDRYL